MVLLGIAAVAYPMAVQLPDFINPPVPPESQGAQLTILKVTNDLNGLKNIFECHNFDISLSYINYTYVHQKYNGYNREKQGKYAIK